MCVKKEGERKMNKEEQFVQEIKNSACIDFILQAMAISPEDCKIPLLDLAFALTVLSEKVNITVYFGDSIKLARALYPQDTKKRQNFVRMCEQLDLINTWNSLIYDMHHSDIEVTVITCK